MRRRKPLRIGNRVQIRLHGDTRTGTLEALVEASTGPEAHVRLTDGDLARVPAFAVRAAPAADGHWWWPSSGAGRLAVVTAVFTVVGAAATVLALILPGNSDPPPEAKKPTTPKPKPSPNLGPGIVASQLTSAMPRSTHRLRAGSITSQADFAYSTVDDVKARTTALWLRLANVGPRPLQVVSITADRAGIAPVPEAELAIGHFVDKSVMPSRRLGVGQQLTYYVSTGFLRRVSSRFLFVHLATGERLRINLGPLIPLFECATYRNRVWKCGVVARSSYVASQPYPWLISLGGALALLPRHPRRPLSKSYVVLFGKRSTGWEPYGSCGFAGPHYCLHPNQPG